METTRKIFINSVKIIGTAFFFYISGQLAMPLSVPPSYAVAIWPPAGIALAATLLWGFKVLPGIFLVDLLINAETYELSTSIASVSDVFWFFFQASNSVFRAWLGCFLIKKFVGFPNPLVSANAIFRFFLMACVGSTLLPAALSIYSILARGVITETDFLFSFLTWWMGDAIGIAIVVPIMFIMFAEPRNIWSKRKFTVGIPLILTLCFTVILCVFFQKMEEQRLRGNFVELSSNVYNGIHVEFQGHFEQLHAVRSFFSAEEDVTPEEFRMFTQRIRQWHKDTLILEWIEKRKKISEEAISSFYVKFAESRKGDLARIELESTKHLPMLLYAWKMNEPVITNVSLFNLINDNKSGFTIYLPVFKSNQEHLQNKEFSNVKGYIAVVIDINAFITEALKGINLQNVLVKINEEQRETGTKLIYKSVNSVSESDPMDLAVHRTMQIAGKKWIIDILPDARYLGENYSWSVWTMLVTGMLFTSFMSFGLLVLTGQSALIQSEVDKRTSELNQANKMLASSEAHFRELVQTQSAIVWRADPETFRFTFVSNEAEFLLGYPIEQWLQHQEFWSNHIYEEDRDQTVEYCFTETRALRNHQIEYRMIAADGRIVWIRDIVDIIIENGKARELVGFMVDITEQKSLEEQLRLAATTFESLQGIIITDKEGKILRVNKAFSDITGYSSDEVIGKNPRIFKSGQHDQDFYNQLWDKLINEGRFEGEIFNQAKDGRIYPEWQTITAVKNDEGATTHYVAVFADITEKKEAEAEINNLAFFDSLTSLPNRRLLLDRLEQEISFSKRNGKYGAIVFLDLDRFKVLNDSLGHHLGDELLVQVGKRLSSVLREVDTAARLGGDEFVVLTHGNADSLEEAADRALIIAEKIRYSLNKTYSLKGHEHHVSPSIGISLFPENSIGPDEILQQADTAMYRSKALGRNTISFFHPEMQESADARLFIEKELRVTLSADGFKLVYQPQIDQSGQIVSVEALIRWVHPDKGILKPADFIPVAEESTLIISIGDWVLRETCQQIKAWDKEGVKIDRVAINVSSRQFRQKDFVERTSRILEESGVSSSRVEIELTESVVIDDIEDTIKKMHALKGLGVLISLDDFGTGYSSLTYLKKLPLDKLKIDRSFIRDIMTDSNDAVIVETIIVMVKHLGLNVVAEGVENQGQLTFLKKKGCTNFQGYLFGKPVTADKLVETHYKK